MEDFIKFIAEDIKANANCLSNIIRFLFLVAFVAIMILSLIRLGVIK